MKTPMEYHERIGELSVAALEKGGEVLLDEVTTDLGVATRHLRRVESGVLALTPAVVREIEDSFARAAKRLA